MSVIFSSIAESDELHVYVIVSTIQGKDVLISSEFVSLDSKLDVHIWLPCGWDSCEFSIDVIISLHAKVVADHLKYCFWKKIYYISIAVNTVWVKCSAWLLFFFVLRLIVSLSFVSRREENE